MIDVCAIVPIVKYVVHDNKTWANKEQNVLGHEIKLITSGL